MPSATAIAEYELVLMLDPETPEDQRTMLTEEVRGQVEAAGELRHGETWGVRKLAYEIGKRNEAEYHLLRFRCEPSLLEELDHSLKIAAGVLRFRIFGVDPRSPIAAPPPPVQAVRERRDRRDSKPRRSGGDGRGRGDAHTAAEDDGAPTGEPTEAPLDPSAEEHADPPAESATSADAAAEAPAEGATSADAAAEAPAEGATSGEAATEAPAEGGPAQGEEEGPPDEGAPPSAAADAEQSQPDESADRGAPS